MAKNGSTPGGGDALDYGVTDQGFLTKPFRVILDEAFARAKQVFGPDIDLRSSSSYRKMQELASLTDAVHWMRLADVYQSRFASSASGQALDLIGEDLGLSRAFLPAVGTAKLKLVAAAPKFAIFNLPVGTIVETTPPAPGIPPQRFRLLAPVTLVKHDPVDGSEQTNAAVSALAPGVDGNIAAKQLTKINATYASRYLSFDPALVDVSNDNPFAGGEISEDDATYRRKLYSLPRSIWTADAVRQAVLALDGVRDAQVYDPYGGIDRAAPLFGNLCFSDATFRGPRDLSNPYYFSITVAPKRGVMWEGDARTDGLREQILSALEPIRPVSIFPTLSLADSVGVAISVRLLLQPAANADGIISAARSALSAYVGSLGMGEPVLYAQVLRAFAETPGVRDVKDLRLRRCPPVFGEIVFGTPAIFGNAVDLSSVENPCGVDLILAPREVAVFEADSPLMNVEVGP
jgi:hypothetical protein